MRTAAIVLTALGLLCSLVGFVLTVRSMWRVASARQLRPAWFTAAERLRQRMLRTLGRQQHVVGPATATASGSGLQIGGTAEVEWQQAPPETLEQRVARLEAESRRQRDRLELNRKEARTRAREARRELRDGLAGIDESLREERKRIDSIDTNALNSELWGLLLVAVGTVLLAVGAILSLI